MRILWDNEFDKHAVVAVSEDANYPKENVQDQRLSRYTRSTSDENQSWKINLAAGTQFNSCVIAGHNITNGATIKIQGSNDDFATTPLDSAITHDAGHMIHFFTSGANYKDWRFFVHDATNPDTYIQIARLVLCNYLDVVEGPHRDFAEEPLDTTVVDFSQSGQVYADEGIIKRRYSLTFKKWTQTMKESLETMFASIKTAKPFFLVIDEDNMDKILPLYCKIAEYPGYTHFSAFRYSGSITFLEVF